MDRYKFRGLRIDNSKEVRGWLCVWQGVVLIFDSPYNLFHNPVEVHPDTVGQYTGLKDKNGVEGYAGNYIHARHKTTKEEIVDRIVRHDSSFSWGVQMDGWVMSLETLVNCYDFTIHDTE